MKTGLKLVNKVKDHSFAKKGVMNSSMLMSNYFRPITTLHKYKSSYSGNKNKKSYFRMFPAAALGLLSLVGGWEFFRKRYSILSEAWGIIGYNGKEHIAGKIILDGLQILQYRGYDSCGIITVDDIGNFVLHKKSSSSGQGGDWIEQVLNMATGKHDHTIGIGHTRWATHGGKTDLNAHPHLDKSGRFAVVHNGMIENFLEIRQLLKDAGIEQSSQTDTELIALYTKYLVDTEGLNTEEAFKRCFAEIDGSNCVLLIDREQPDRLYAAKNSGSLLIGIHDKGFCVSSQVAAFQAYTRKYVQVPDNEVIVIAKDEIMKGGKLIDKKKVRLLRKENIDLVPKHGYKWFFEQEIYEQPEAVSRTLNFGGRISANNRVKLGGLETREDDLKAIENLVIAACGTSLYAGKYGSLLMKKLHVFESVTPCTASDITEDYLYPRNTGILSITQSGETEDLKKAIRLAKSKNLICFNIINVVESEIARMTELGVFLNSGREVSVPSTKVFLCQAIALVLITWWFAERKAPNRKVLERIELLENLKVFIMKVQETIYENRYEIEDIAKEIYRKDYMAVLGKGLCTPIAEEAALKIKEVTYMHAEGYSSGEFKHGPLALVEEGKKTVGWIYILDDENFEFNKSTLEQLKAKQAYTIVITDCKHKLADDLADKFIKIPNCGDLTPLLGIIPMQLLTLYIANLRGNDVDRPRNLARTITV
jgi:glutamine---fructose-6-phosphate transaminase (isomerizing)